MASEVYLSLGSNLHSPLRQLRLALDAIRALPKTQLLSKSRIYKTSPLGVKQQGVFFNMAICIKTVLTPYQLLDCCQDIETRHGRVRSKRWGPRTLDIDILLFKDLHIRTSRLVVPHPQMQYRDFVLVPLMEVWQGKNIFNEVKNCKPHIISVR